MSITTKPSARPPSGFETYPLRGYVGHRLASGSVYWTQPEELPTPVAAWVFADAHRAAAEVRITDRTGDDLLLHVEAGRLVFPTENEGLAADLIADFNAGRIACILRLANPPAAASR